MVTCPPKSPYLNPFAHLWDVLDRSMEVPPYSLEDSISHDFGVNLDL